MSEAPRAKDILGVPLEVGDCVALAGASPNALIVGNISEIVAKEYTPAGRQPWWDITIRVVTQAGRKTSRRDGRVAFILRNTTGGVG